MSEPPTGEEFDKSKGRHWSLLKNNYVGVGDENEVDETRAPNQLVLGKGQQITIYDSPYSPLTGLEEFFLSHPLRIVSEHNLYN